MRQGLTLTTSVLPRSDVDESFDVAEFPGLEIYNGIRREATSKTLDSPWSRLFVGRVEKVSVNLNRGNYNLVSLLKP